MAGSDRPSPPVAVALPPGHRGGSLTSKGARTDAVVAVFARGRPCTRPGVTAAAGGEARRIKGAVSTRDMSLERPSGRLGSLRHHSSRETRSRSQRTETC